MNAAPTIEERRVSIIGNIARIKARKLDGWMKEVKGLCDKLHELETMFDEHANHGGEQEGRKGKFAGVGMASPPGAGDDWMRAPSGQRL